MGKLYISQIAAYVERLTGKAQQVIVTSGRPEIRYSSYGDGGVFQKAQPLILICDKDVAVDSIVWSDDHGLRLNACGPFMEQIHNAAEKSHVILWDTDCEVAHDKRGIYVDETGAQNGVLVLENCHHPASGGVCPAWHDIKLMRRYDVRRPENRVWIYNRVGSDAEALARNETLLRGYADRNGFSIAGVTSELGPGSSLWRAKTNELYGAAKENLFDILLMTRADRLGRKQYKWDAVQAFVSWGLSVKCLSEDLCIHAGNIDFHRAGQQTPRMDCSHSGPQMADISM